MTNYKKLFDPKLNTSQLSLIYFSYCDKIDGDDKEALYEAYINASRIAQNREFDEADQGIMR